MLLKSLYVAIGAFSATSSALFTDVETGAQPGKINHLSFSITTSNRNIPFKLHVGQICSNKSRPQHLQPEKTPIPP